MKNSNVIRLSSYEESSSPLTESHNNPHFTINNLEVEIGKKTIFNNVSMNIQRGQITAVIGPSGCGKSTFLTTLNQLSRINPDIQVNGQIDFNEQNILDDQFDLINLRRSVGMIFQQPNPFPLSIKQNLDLPLREHGFNEQSVREQKIKTALQDVGLWDEVKNRLDNPALALSGGQQQRLCIARTITLEPEVILLDEPCSALDPLSSAIVEDLMVKLTEKFTLVVVTHNLAQARRIADYVAFFWAEKNVGKLVEFGSCRQVFKQPKKELTKAYISGARG